MRFLRLFWFHLRLYAKNQYFFWLVITSTTSLFLMQYIVAYASNNLSDNSIWLRSGVFGLWSSATTAAGSVTFQRYQGTLKYLVNGRVDERISLAALVMPAASFGLLAFPISYLLSRICQVQTGKFSVELIIDILCFWIASITMDLLIASFFVLTRNAMVYEGLLTIPILLLSGLFGTPKSLMPILLVGKFLIPISVPVQQILSTPRFDDWLPFTVSLVIWITIATKLSKRLISGYRSTGDI